MIPKHKKIVEKEVEELFEASNVTESSCARLFFVGNGDKKICTVVKGDESRPLNISNDKKTHRPAGSYDFTHKA